MVTCEQQGAETLITLQPNRSATVRQSMWFLLLVSGVTLSVAVFWTFYGAWLVLPFAALGGEATRLLAGPAIAVLQSGAAAAG